MRLFSGNARLVLLLFGGATALGLSACAKHATAPTPSPEGAVSAATLSFDSVAVGEFSQDRRFVISNSGGGQLRGRVDCTSPHFSLTMGQGDFSLAAGQSLDVAVQFCPQTEGALRCTVSTGLPSIVVCDGFGTPGPKLDLQPKVLDFGTVTVGYEVARLFTITNVGGGVLVDTVRGAGGAFSLAGIGAGQYVYSLRSGQSASFRVLFAPTDGGANQAARLRVGRSKEVECAGSGRIVQPPIFAARWTSYQPYGLAAVGNDSIFVVEAGNHLVDLHSSLGNLLNSWRFVNGRVIAADRNGSLLIATSSEISKVSVGGSVLKTWRSAGTALGVSAGISGLATDPVGNIYAVETNTKLVKKYTSAGQFVGSWGGLGDGNGQFRSPQAIAYGPDGYLYVADAYGYIQVFTTDGVFLKRWGAEAHAEGHLDVPVALAFLPDGNLLICDGTTPKVFSRQGEFLRDFGGSGFEPGQFASPAIAATVTSDGRMFLGSMDGYVSKFIWAPNGVSPGHVH